MNHLPNPTPVAPATPSVPELFTAEALVALGAILDDLRTRRAHTPSLDFAEGFLAALVCCRRQITANEYLPVLLALPPGQTAMETAFADAGQQQRFMRLWQHRWHDVAQALDTPVAALDDPAAYQPAVTDARAIHAALPETERAKRLGTPVPAFGQVWAQGFLAAVQAWPLEWAGPRNKAAHTWRNSALEVVQRLTLDDLDPPTLSAFDDDNGPPTVSPARMQAFGDAIWAVVNMRQTWRRLGPRIETVVKPARLGRNAPCPCGSGQKFKRCCGG